jgi:hypothetical protein
MRELAGVAIVLRTIGEKEEGRREAALLAETRNLEADMMT